MTWSVERGVGCRVSSVEKKTLRRGWNTLAAGVLLLGLLAGCGKKEAETAGGPPPGAPPTPGKKIKIVYIPKNTGNHYFDSINEGFKKAAAELNFDFVTVAPAKAEATSQIEFIKQQVQQHVDAIAITPNSVDAILPALKEAMSRGIKIVTINADMTGHEEGRDVAILPVDFNDVGKSQIELLSELMGGKGEFAILSATTDAPDQNFWIAGMKTTLQDPKFKDLKLVETAYGNDDPQKSETEASGLLTKYPNLHGILSPTTVGVAAAAHVVQTTKTAGRVMVTGLGSPDLMRQYVNDGTVKKFALWNPADQGYLAGNLLVGMVNGTIKPAPGTTFKAGSLGDRKFGEKNVVITGPPTVFEKSNIEQYHF